MKVLGTTARIATAVHAPRLAPTPKAGPSREVVPEIGEVTRVSNAVLDEVGKVIVGKRQVMELVMVAVLTEGAHILFEDYPGLAKTLMASTFARSSGATFTRIQFTPDLLPTDILGSYIYDQKEGKFDFRQGPIFTNVLLADEINRASPKTQSALLEAMAERQATVEGVTHALTPPFLVMATQNPIEQEGTYPLPEAQLDRFAMRVSVGYPDRREEAEVLNRRIRRGHDSVEVRKITDPKMLLGMQRIVERVHVHPRLVDYVSELVVRTRENPAIQVGSSPRGSLALMKLSRANAALQGRDFVTPDDIRRLFLPTLNHRIQLRPEYKIKGVRPQEVLETLMREVPVPQI